MTSHVLERDSVEPSRTSPDDARLDLTQRIMAIAFGPPDRRPFGVRYWTGRSEPGDPRQRPAFTLVIRDPRALRRGLLPPSELAFGEAFIRGDLDVEGDLEAAGSLMDVLRANL